MNFKANCKSDVSKAVNHDLCVSCGICVSACPVEAISMSFVRGIFLPTIDNQRCIGCGLCFEVCPGVDIIDPENLMNTISCGITPGDYIECYVAFTKHYHIRKASTSGGVITTLITELIKNGDYDEAFVLNFGAFKGKEAALTPKGDIAKIIQASGSKYVPASVAKVIDYLKARGSKKYIIVATPCQLKGIKKYMRAVNIDNVGLLFLGLFCDSTMNFNMIRYFEESYAKNGERLSDIKFRTKEKNGWPGDTKLVFDSGRVVIINRSVRMTIKGYFKLNRCLFCFDKLNISADISFGDCYVRGEESVSGKSSVIIRTERGKQAFDRCRSVFSLKDISIFDIFDSQQVNWKMENVEHAAIISNHLTGKPDISFLDKWTWLRLQRLQKQISYGQNYSKNRFRMILMTSQLKTQLINGIYGMKRLGAKLLEICKVCLLCIEAMLVYRDKSNIAKINRDGKNIVIVGGGLANKGAEAMTFTAVDQMKQRFPWKECYVFLTDECSINHKERNLYAFNLLPATFQSKFEILFPANRLFVRENRYGEFNEKILECIRESIFMIDISGYALSSEFHHEISIDFLLNIILAKKFSVPIYLLPQSIGPFEYEKAFKGQIMFLIKKCLKYPVKIFLREKTGFSQLSKCIEGNLEMANDIVLQSENYYEPNIIHGRGDLKPYQIEPNSVGIVPNSQVTFRIKGNQIYSLYRDVITGIVDMNKKAYILMSALADWNICDRMKKMFLNNDNVVFIHDNMNAIELENIIQQFDYLLASRYHSIIYAYKHEVPVIAIGWAQKYYELLEQFDQLPYFFDCRKGLNSSEIISAAKRMSLNLDFEREKIKAKMASVREENLFGKYFNPLTIQSATS